MPSLGKRLSVGAFAVIVSVSANTSLPPVYSITAHSLRDAGLQIGKSAATRIQGWFETDEMKGFRNFALGDGKDAFEAMKKANKDAFPQIADEIEGIAEGANVSVDDVWLANMLEELGNLRTRRGEHIDNTHCSDVYAISEKGYKGGFAQGHNEDWSDAVKPFWYFVELHPAPGADFEFCAGHAYPAGLVGWATTWNSHGMYLTQNAVSPYNSTPGGLVSAFIQKEAICGEAGSKGLNGVIKSLTSRPWSEGASVNLVDLKAKRMANVELYEGEFAVTEVTEKMGNYSHFNMYKALKPGVLDPPQVSTLHRQARVDALPPSRSRKDVMDRLSDHHDEEYPIYRETTLVTFILDGHAGRVDIWCCGTSASSGPEPFYSWNIWPFHTNKSDTPAKIDVPQEEQIIVYA
mmetsp:Transcript_13944/g.30355  ORF Transcript_13944/g.30355 Transcript_13944/m.30355 type:complete len:406 (+) Transcript_13944:46-1263(+)